MRQIIGQWAECASRDVVSKTAQKVFFRNPHVKPKQMEEGRQGLTERRMGLRVARRFCTYGRASGESQSCCALHCDFSVARAEQLFYARRNVLDEAIELASRPMRFDRMDAGTTISVGFRQQCSSHGLTLSRPASGQLPTLVTFTNSGFISPMSRRVYGE